jgi:hypothetical protein
LYFSGFSLQNDEKLFKEYLEESDFVVSGFSYGAQKALEFAINNDTRIDKLQLFSPAFFNDKDEKYKRMQLMFFKKDSDKYCSNFLENCGLKELQKEDYFKMGTFEELKDLLYYEWEEDKLQAIVEKGVKIEVYLGSDDKICDSQKSLEFFKELGEVYYIKNVGHILS